MLEAFLIVFVLMPIAFCLSVLFLIFFWLRRLFFERKPIPPCNGIFKIRNGHVRYVADHSAPCLTREECEKYKIDWGWIGLDDYTAQGYCLRGWDSADCREGDLMELITKIPATNLT